ncbi:MAG: SDR family NAD(P)-dependent oxidoreductase [Anaerolineaceae bacterium]|jgi:meso-butanediol dehydrogenase/(S,S)-butanediol dehydrogenase/diacetyl reductase
MNLLLEGRVALVTGGGRGMGRGICKILAEEGAHVIVADIVMENAMEVVNWINEHGGHASQAHIDITDPVSVEKVFTEAIEEFGKVDILVNNAGVTRMNKFEDIPLKEFNFVFNVNTTGTFICCQEFTKHAIEGNYGGSILNIASNAGKVGFQNQLHYNAAKAAVINMTRNLAAELAPHHINVNAICPGAVATEMLMEVARSLSDGDEDEAKKIMQSFAVPQLGRLVLPEEIGKIVAFLVSDSASIIRGQSINVDGGATPY